MKAKSANAAMRTYVTVPMNCASTIALTNQQMETTMSQSLRRRT